MNDRLLPRAGRRNPFVSLLAAAFPLLSIGCGQASDSRQATGGCASGQVHCASCGAAGFCAAACPQLACPAGDAGGVEDAGARSDAGACPAASPDSCADCAGATFCVAGGCPQISCPDDAGSASDGGGPGVDAGNLTTDGGNSAACPASEPTGSCSEEGLSCGYHCVGCTCTGGVWDCPGLGCAGGFYECPTPPPAEGSPCVTDGCCGSNFTPCWYGGVNGQNERADCVNDQWHLTAPVSQVPDAGTPACGTTGCPTVPPFSSGTGGTCTAPITCSYGIGGSCSCSGAAWTCDGAEFEGCPQTLPDAGSPCAYPYTGFGNVTYGQCAYGSKVCGCTAAGWVCC